MHQHTTPQATQELAIEVRGLRCFYEDFEAVRGIDLQVPRGELLAILGTNGAGKTTTLDVLGGRRAPDAGQVRVLGLDPLGQHRAVAARTGVMLQQSGLPSELTPLEFLGLWHRMAGGGTLTHRPAAEQLAMVDLSHRRDVRIGRLSGGERRRLELAVALSAEPELLLLDEPTSGLDPESRRETWHLIRERLRTGTTIVLSTHHLEEADALADRLVIMHEGAVAVAGPVNELVAASDARIRFEVDDAFSLPIDALAGHMATSPAAESGIEIRTDDLAGDLETLLAWSRQRATPLRRLHASEATLAEIFHEVREPMMPEEART